MIVVKVLLLLACNTCMSPKYYLINISNGFNNLSSSSKYEHNIFVTNIHKHTDLEI